MEKVWESIVSAGAPIAFLVVAAVVFALLPNGWKNWLRRWRGVLAAGFFLALATVAISFGLAILVTDDHFGAATPKDAYVVGPFLIVLGLAIVGFAVAAAAPALRTSTGAARTRDHNRSSRSQSWTDCPQMGPPDTPRAAGPAGRSTP
jgi:cytochrome c biogenesis protein CcdA